MLQVTCPSSTNRSRAAYPHARWQAVDRRTRLSHMVAGSECAEKLPLTPGQIQRRHIQVISLCIPSVPSTPGPTCTNRAIMVHLAVSVA